MSSIFLNLLSVGECGRSGFALPRATFDNFNHVPLASAARKQTLRQGFVKLNDLLKGEG
jgi:hypothetical protein